MAFVVPSGSFETGSPVLGALTGLTQGLAQGIQDRSRMDAVKQELALRAQDQALRERAYAHGLTNEAQQQEYYGSMGKLMALGAQHDIGAPVQGPQTPPQQPLGAGEQGPMPQQAAQLPPDQSAWLNQAMDIGSHIKDPKALEAFHAEVQSHLAQNAIATHQQRIASQIQDGILQGHFNTLGPGGTEDPSQTEAAKAILQAVQSANPQNPQEAAALLDHAEQQIGQLRVQVAQHNTQMMLRQKTGESLLKQMEESWGSGHNIDEATSIYHLWQSGVLDDKGLEKVWPDALAGTLTLKNNLLQMKSQLDAANMELLKTRAAAMETPQQRLGREVATSTIKGEAARDVAETRARGSSGLEDKRTARVDTELDALVRRNALTAAQQDKDWPKADTDEKKQAIVDRYVQLQQRKNGNLVLPSSSAGSPSQGASSGKLGAQGAGSGDSASSILEAVRSGSMDKATAIKKATALGFKNFEELQKAAGGK